MRELRLWDGEEYDRDEVARVAPLLVEHADKYSILGERIEHKPPKIGCLAEGVSTVLLVLVMPFGVIAGVGILVFHAPLVDNPFLQALVEAAIIVAVFVIAGRLGRRVVFSMKSESVWIEDGLVNVEKGRKIQVVPLHECAWHKGFAYEDLYSVEAPHCLRVCLTHPDLIWSHGKFGTRTCIGLGTNEDMRRLWTEFLRLANVRRQPDTPRWAALAGITASVTAFCATRLIVDILVAEWGLGPVMLLAVYLLPWFLATFAGYGAAVWLGDESFAIKPSLAWMVVARLALMLFGFTVLLKLPIRPSLVFAAAMTPICVLWAFAVTRLVRKTDAATVDPVPLGIEPRGHLPARSQGR